MTDQPGGPSVERDAEEVSTRPAGGRRRTAKNIASMLSLNVARRGAMLVIYLLVARHLGAHQFGQLSLAVVLLQSWRRFAMVGMETLLAREVASNRGLVGSCFVHASVIGLFASIVCFVLIIPFTMLMGYSPDTSKVIYLTFLGLTPLVLSHVCEGVFQGRERMDLVAYVSVPIYVLNIAAVFACIKLNLGLPAVAASLSAMQLVIMLVQWVVLVSSEGMPELRFSFRRASEMIRASSAFLGIQAVNAIKMSLTVTVLSKLFGETSVGVYSAANQLLVPFSLLFNNVALALFPSMCRGFGNSAAEFRVVVSRVVEGMMVIAMPATVGLFMLAYPIVSLFYQDADFSLSGSVLRVIVWSLIVQALTHVMGQALWASSREKLSLRITVTNTLVQGVSCVVLATYFGVIGAAISVLLTSLLNLIQHIIPTAKLLSVSGVVSASIKPLVASALMALTIVSFGDRSLGVSIAYAIVSYALALTALYVWSAGGLTQFRSECASFWAA